MDNTLKTLLNSYERTKATIRNKLDANKATIEKLNAETKKFFQDCENFKDRLNVCKENKLVIKENDQKIAAAYENEAILHTALKACNEMKVKTVANALHDEIISNPEKWSKYPLHFQKFKNMVADFLSDTGLYLIDSYNIGSYYITGSYDYHNISGYVFHAPKRVLDNQVLDEMRSKERYNIIPAADILKETKKAFTARKKILAKYENAKKEIDALRGPFSSTGAFCNILPYVNSAPENYKRL